ncbi:hypothetical protein [Candidatus Synechococcus calcipolaris]
MIKTELIHPIEFQTRAIAKTTIAEWIDVFYNLIKDTRQ